MSSWFSSVGDQFQVLAHDVLINKRRDDGFSFSCCGTDCAEEMRVFKLLQFDGTGTATPFCPKSCRLVLLTKSGFVLKPNINLVWSYMDRCVKDRFQSKLF